MKNQKGGMNDECPICLETIHHTDEYTRLRCPGGHYLHDECLAGLRGSNEGSETLCPLCRVIIDDPHETLIKYIENEIFDDNMEEYGRINLNRARNIVRHNLITVLSYDIAGFIIKFKMLELENNNFNNEEFAAIKVELLEYINDLISEINESSDDDVDVIEWRDLFLLTMFKEIIDELEGIIYDEEIIDELSLEEYKELDEFEYIEIRQKIATFIRRYLITGISGGKPPGRKKTKKVRKKDRKTRKKQNCYKN